jgi:hypothetical protein
MSPPSRKESFAGTLINGPGVTAAECKTLLGRRQPWNFYRTIGFGSSYWGSLSGLMLREEAVADHVITTAAMERRNKIVGSD